MINLLHHVDQTTRATGPCHHCHHSTQGSGEEQDRRAEGVGERGRHDVFEGNTECDQRTTAQCDYTTETVGKARLTRLTCNPALTGFSAPKIIWLREHEPAVYEKVEKVLLPKDYIRFMLSGEFAAEVSDASGTLLFDVINRRWSTDVLNMLDIPEKWLPPVYESHEPTTKLRAPMSV